MNPVSIRVEVAYARPGAAIIRRLQLEAGCTLLEAVSVSGLLRDCPEIDLSRDRVGIFGRLARPDTVLRDGDRVEVYRPLTADPKEARRRRAGSTGNRA